MIPILSHIFLILGDRLVQLLRLFDTELLTAIGRRYSVQFDHKIILETLWVLYVWDLRFNVTAELEFFIGFTVWLRWTLASEVFVGGLNRRTSNPARELYRHTLEWLCAIAKALKSLSNAYLFVTFINPLIKLLFLDAHMVVVKVSNLKSFGVFELRAACLLNMLV